MKSKRLENARIRVKDARKLLMHSFKLFLFASADRRRQTRKKREGELTGKKERREEEKENRRKRKEAKEKSRLEKGARNK